MTENSATWVALAIGNSWLHWAQFEGEQLQQVWQTPHLAAFEEFQLVAAQISANAELWLASVVPAQTQYWLTDPKVQVLELAHIPLQGMYASFGIDRALALWGAIQTLTSPVLVIDAGTALTLTGAVGDRLVGGAILPGLRLQFQALGQQTAALPEVSPERLREWPSRWALNTADAIASGIFYTVLAGVISFIEAWQQEFPASQVVLTGGDCDRLYSGLQQQVPDLSTHLTTDANLLFRGIQAIRRQRA